MTGDAVLSAGLIGAGWIAERHLAVLDEAADVRLAAVCDTDLGRAQAVAGARGAHAYQRWEELLERQPLDVLWVCTPPLHHRDPAVEALRRGIHVYLEKPLARDIADEVLVMNRGRLCEAGPIDRVLSNPADEYTRRLLEAAPSLGEPAIA